MANITLIIHGLNNCLDEVTPLLGQISAAYQQYGINLNFSKGMVLPDDPERTQSWPSLIALLEQRSAMLSPRPAHLVITLIPPTGDGSINGMLLNPMRGIAAIYLESDAFRSIDPNSRAAMVTQVCMHEIGHLLDLTHTDASDRYANAMMPSSVRLTQSPQYAWQRAISDAQNRGEPAMIAPERATYFPFNSQCRTYLRAAAHDPLWWPWATQFRGDYQGANDSNLLLNLDVDIHRKHSSLSSSAGNLSFTLAISNNSGRKVTLPLHIEPTHGSLRVTAGIDMHERNLYRPPNVLCSNARQTLQPGQKISRSFNLSWGNESPLFTTTGTSIIEICLTDFHKRKAVTLGKCSARIHINDKLNKTPKSQASENTNFVKSQEPTLSSSWLKEIQKSYESHVEENSRQNAAHIEEMISCASDCDVPLAVRHKMAHQMAFARALNGETWEHIISDLSKVFKGEIHDELWHRINRSKTKGMNHG